MQVKFETRGDFDNLEKWLDRMTNYTPTASLHKIAQEGGSALSKNTPRNTGQTASGWTSEVTHSRGIFEVSWMNNAHPGLSINLARMLDQGYTTGTGGYVPPRPYVKDSMKPVWKKAGNDIAKEMTK